MLILRGRTVRYNVVCEDRLISFRRFFNSLHPNFTSADIIGASANFFRGISYLILYPSVRFIVAIFILDRCYHPRDFSDRILPCQKHDIVRDLYSLRSLNTMSLVNAFCARKHVLLTRESRFKVERTTQTIREMKSEDSPDEEPWSDDGLAWASPRPRLCQSRGWEDQRSGLCCCSTTSVSRVS